MNKPLLFRVDCNDVIASGHLMRCISLAQEAVKQDFDVTFIMSDGKSEDILNRFGFNLVNLNSDWKNLDDEIPGMVKLSERYAGAVLIIDTYSVTPIYTESLKSFYNLVYLGSKMDCLPGIKVLINYSTSIDYSFYKRHYGNTELLLGPKFTPLRNEFRDCQIDDRVNVKHVLVTTGNTDPQLFTAQLLTLISKQRLDNIEFEIIVGNMFKNVAELLDMQCKNANFHFHTHVSRMSDIYKMCQLAVSANGTTVYELCACHMPTISFALVKEQETSGEKMGELGMVDYCGLYNSDDDTCLTNVVSKLKLYINDNKRRLKLIETAASMIDTNGCKRIISSIINL